MAPLPPQLAEDRLREAHAAAAAIVRHTPLLTSASISRRCGGQVALKAECLQRTGSFKLRGALAKLRGLGIDPAHPAQRGVVAGSAGNHAQSLAYAARHAGVPCEVYMPLDAAVSKLDAVRAFGAIVHQEGTSVDDCVSRARTRAREGGLAFVHPFDDPDVIAGQAGLGLELLADVPDLRMAIVPVGGGGLASGVALALKQQRPDVTVIGVQAAACAPLVAARAGREPPAISATIADGIAVKRPGELTAALLGELLDDVVAVEDEAIAEAMILLLERSKLVVEGAGAAALAALLSGAVAPAAHGTTVAILSGGNVDVGLLASIAAHEETRAGRRARLFTHVADRPGGLAGLLAAIAEQRGNVIAVEHVRDGVALAVRESGLALTIETRGPEHLASLLTRLREDGYEVAVRD